MGDNKRRKLAEALSDSTSSDDDNESSVDSPGSTPPPSFQEIDFQNRHIALQDFGEGLQTATKALFPNETRSRYAKVSVLMMSWEDEDPNLPVSIEISKLHEVFSDIYGFRVEKWAIPDQDSHFEVNQKIGSFVRPAADDTEHLRIVYYAGHGRLTRNRTLAWTSWRNKDKKGTPTLIWSGIQVLLEQAQSDVLILLDCCASGTTNTGEGNGVTELIAACPYNSKANGVGPYSFTNALVIELKLLSQRPLFSVGELYSNIYCRTQNRMPEDGRERHPPPIHLTLTREHYLPRSIQLPAPRRPLENTEGHQTHPDISVSCIDGRTLIFRGSALLPLSRGDGFSATQSHLNDQEPPRLMSIAPKVPKVPRLAFAIRLRDSFRIGELSEDLFKEWLRTIPAFVEEVRVEAGFDSFSSLLVVSMPISMSIYIPHDPAVMCLGPITSANILVHPKLILSKDSVPEHEPLTSPVNAELVSEIQVQRENIMIEEFNKVHRALPGIKGPVRHEKDPRAVMKDRARTRGPKSSVKDAPLPLKSTSRPGKAMPPSGKARAFPGSASSIPIQTPTHNDRESSHESLAISPPTSPTTKTWGLSTPKPSYEFPQGNFAMPSPTGPGGWQSTPAPGDVPRNEMIALRAELLLSLVNKGPESKRGVSMNKALKRYHRERNANGSRLSRGDEEKELWRIVRMKRNERGEIVLFLE